MDGINWINNVVAKRTVLTRILLPQDEASSG
jgi:hypothetical protein